MFSDVQLPYRQRIGEVTSFILKLTELARTVASNQKKDDELQTSLRSVSIRQLHVPWLSEL